MGGLLNRSSAAQGNIKIKKDKRKQRQHQQLAVSFEPDVHIIRDKNEDEDSNIDFIHAYESWEPQRMMNTNDPPGAPSTYPSNYSATQNDRTWSSPVNSNHSFYPMNPFQMTQSYNHAYIPHQGQIPEVTKTVVPEERPSKKVQFSTSNQPQQTSSFKQPLTSTQSWHELNDVSAQSTGKHVSLSNRSSLPRTLASTPKNPSARTPVEKPIYIGVDFQATLAERGQTNGTKRHHRSGEKSHSDGLNSSSNIHRVRSNPTHQHKHQTPTDSPKSNISSILQKPSEPQRVSINSKLSQNTEQSNEIKPIKPRHHHRQQQQLSTNNDINSSKNRENRRRHHHHHQQQQQQFPSPPIIQSSTQQIERKQSGTPMMRIPLSQLNHHHQQQPIVLSSATKTTKVHRIPIQA